MIVTPWASPALDYPYGDSVEVVVDQDLGDPAGGVEGCSWSWNWTCPFWPLLHQPKGIVQTKKEEGQLRPDVTSASSQIT